MNRYLKSVWYIVVIFLVFYVVKILSDICIILDFICSKKNYSCTNIIKAKGSLKKTIESVSMLIPHWDPQPPTVSALGFFATFLDYWGCLVCCETDFVTFLVNFDQNNAKLPKRRTAKI